MANRFTFPRETALDSNGSPLSGARLYFYEAGTTKPASVYSDAALTIAAANPVVADSAGRFPDIFLQAIDYKTVLAEAGGAIVWTADPVSGTLDTRGDDFAPSQQSPADMTVLVGGGSLFDTISRVLIEQSAQSTPLITAPVSNPRHDIVYVDRRTGTVGIETGTEAAVPTDPAFPAGVLPVARVRLQPATTEISEAEIDDIRELDNLGWGALDEDDMASDSADLAPTQQSVRAYVNGAARGHIFGLELSNSGADAANDIDISSGTAMSGDGTTLLVYDGGTVQADAPFGTGNGGLSSSLTFAANTTYHFFLCTDLAGIARVGIDTSLTAANLIADHAITNPRLIMSLKTAAGPAWPTFKQHGDWVILDWVQDSAINNPGTLAVLVTTSLPTGADLFWVGAIILNDVTTGATVYMLVTSPYQTDAAAGSGRFSVSTDNATDIGDDGSASYNQPVLTNTAAQIRFRLSTSDADITVRTITTGYIHPRGRNG